MANPDRTWKCEPAVMLYLHSYPYLCSSMLIIWGNEAITINYMHWRTSKPPLSVSCPNSHAEWCTESRRITDFDITQGTIYSYRGPGIMKMWRPLSVNYIWSVALYCAETWTLRKLVQKYLESFEMWRWRRMEKISWTERVNTEAVLHRVKEERNILHTIRRRKANWIGHILRRNCLLSHIIEGKIMGTRRRGRRRKQPLDDLKEARRYWKFKEEAQDRTLWRTQFGRGYGHLARQTTTWLDYQ
jgi:hypothetical protein